MQLIQQPSLEQRKRDSRPLLSIRTAFVHPSCPPPCPSVCPRQQLQFSYLYSRHDILAIYFFLFDFIAVKMEKENVAFFYLHFYFILFIFLKYYLVSIALLFLFWKEKCRADYRLFELAGQVGAASTVCRFVI
jgi:hypothetical protein